MAVDDDAFATVDNEMAKVFGVNQLVSMKEKGENPPTSALE